MQLLFLSTEQAELFDENNISNLIDAFEVPKPQLVIELMESRHGIAYERWLEQLGQPIAHSGILNNNESMKAERDLTLLFQDLLIPLAASNHALIFVELQPECTMLRCLETAVEGVRGRYGKRLPFTILGIDTAMHFHDYAIKDGFPAEQRKKFMSWTAQWGKLNSLHDAILQKRKEANKMDDNNLSDG